MGTSGLQTLYQASVGNLAQVMRSHCFSSLLWGGFSVSNRGFVINAPSVVSETIDGEVVIMNLTSGNYYSSDGTGAVIWGWIEEGKCFGEIEQLALCRYDAAAEIISGALTAFLDRLLEEKLIHETTVPTAPAAPNPPGADASPARESFAAPEVHVYKDMQDLLLLDPIHDVDEAGWPRQAETHPATPHDA
jgi:hypothetical protein